MKPKTMEIIPEALAGTIEILWGPQMVPVADRVHAVVDRIVRQQYQNGFQSGLEQGVKDASAPSAVGGPQQTCASDGLPCDCEPTIRCTPPEDLYGDDMWDHDPSDYTPVMPPEEERLIRDALVKSGEMVGELYSPAGSAPPPHPGGHEGWADDVIQHDSGDEQPEAKCGDSTALCVHFPNCGCIA